MTHQLSLRLELEAAPDAALTLSAMRGREAISQLFRFEIDAWCPKTEALDVPELLGSRAALVFEIDGMPVRTIRGALRSIRRSHDLRNERVDYSLELVPSAHLLQLITTTDVFTDELAAPELIGKKLDQCEVPFDTSQLVGSYPKRDFWVQWAESDWAFVCRRAEHLGISFYVESGDDDDRLVFVDTMTGFAEAKEPYAMVERPEDLGIVRLTSTTQCTPGVFLVMDYNYLTPDIDLTSDSESEIGFAGGTVEWGPFVTTPGEGQQIADVRRQQVDTTREQWRGEATAPTLAAGQRITVEGLDEDLRLLVIEVAHRCDLSSPEGRYHADLVAVDAALPYRPPRRTPVPRVDGVVSALIEPQEHGTIGSTAQLDEHGRYRVKFRFDTTELDGKASCPTRLVHTSTGPDYGMHFPLKPGVEVAVAFVNGDPDRPVIVGSLHNASTPAPVRDKNAKFSVVKTECGITMKMRDA